MRVIIICVLNVSIACIVFSRSKTTQTSALPGVLQRAVFTDQERSVTTTEAFYASLNRARAPGGVVTMIGCQDAVKRSWKPQGQPLGMVLNELVGVDRSYRWEVQDGAINLLPTSGEPLLLQTHIGESNLRTKSSLDALNQLMMRSEIKEAMINLHLKGGLAIIMYSPSATEFSVSFKGGTLRQALNAIAIAKDSDIWDYRERHCAERND